MYGTNLQLIVLRCCACPRWVALRVDPDDVFAFTEGMYIQDACPYLSPDLRELFISQTCGDCWSLLCSSDPLTYSQVRTNAPIPSRRRKEKSHMHSFSKRTQTPLTLDEIAQRAPSALATRPYDAMSARYTYVPTLGVIKAMIAAGFQPFSAVQSRTRIVGKGEFTKHMLRFRYSGIGNLVVGDLIPEVVLINSHDGTSAYKLIAGLYRLVCSNGMIVSDGEIDSINVAHKGNIVHDVLDGSHRLIADTQKSLGTVRNWRQLQLTDGEQHAFAEAAHTLRFADGGGKVTTPITPDQLLVPRRREDVGGDLWHTLNRVQENVIAGGLHAIQRNANGRRVRRISTRRINGIDQDVRLNRALWALAGRMAELKGECPKVVEAEFVESKAA
jgi:hypothetical protein